MKVVLPLVLSALSLLLFSNISYADDGNKIFRTDRLTINKPVKPAGDVESQSVKRSDRVTFYKTDQAGENSPREVIRRSDRIVLTK